jgi:hypothetical protein
MAYTGGITPGEIERQAVACLVGQSYTIMLATQSGALGLGSTWAAWAAAVISGGGYANLTGTLAAGAWNSGGGYYGLAAVTATWTPTTPGFTFDSVIIRLGSATYPHSVNMLAAPVFAAPDAPISIPIDFRHKAVAA